jgi:hypothetical protein
VLDPSVPSIPSEPHRLAVLNACIRNTFCIKYFGDFALSQELLGHSMLACKSCKRGRLSTVDLLVKIACFG